MRKVILLRVACLGLLLSLAVAALAASPDWFSATTSGTDGSCLFYNDTDSTWVYERFSSFPGWAKCVDHLAYAKEHGKGAENIFLYMTITDLRPYITTSADSGWEGSHKSTWVRERVVELYGDEADSAELCYLHFYDSTEIVDGGDTLYIGGTGSLTITAADSVNRVPNAYVNVAVDAGNTYEYPCRTAPNLPNTKVRQAIKEYVATAWDTSYDAARENDWGTRSTLEDGTPALPDGIFLDNASSVAINAGTQCILGGKVVETRFVKADSTHSDTDSLYGWAQNDSHFRGWAWYWQKQMYRDIRDTLKIADQWSPDSNTKQVCGNLGEQNWAGSYDSLTPWSNAVGQQLYVDSLGCDAVLTEWGYDLIYRHNESVYAPWVLHTRDSTFAASGGKTFWNARVDDSRINPNNWVDGSWLNKMLLNYAFFLTFRSDSCWYDVYATPYPYGVFYNENFDSLHWPQAFAVPLGSPETHYVQEDSGSSPDGGPYYKIFSRDYTNGDTAILVLCRTHDGADEEYGDADGHSVSVNYALGGTYKRLSYDGSWGSNITEVDIHGAEAMILMSADTSEAEAATSTEIQGVTIKGVTIE